MYIDFISYCIYGVRPNNNVQEKRDVILREKIRKNMEKKVFSLVEKIEFDNPLRCYETK